ncbi:hypothetical protein TVAG_452160 [Trichomonas vaginalis G3]|uniref:Tubby C-terminal domain-containing protein n=1 Tax=Trichomonas vaginalis (strain ATCC PRA-98 / G3) TaxID=412133 RepID=A2DJT8_TRIV3|nr:hypothetical protein TVAGG3_0290190 [Trichomonas vaginalis G3]EAY19302.1 hypothetical protein TVAG_452160 [Trichomonas vaginalis G3]KAI5527203.1 hypothetical protein TVAGG3_0290190 [Trichomonas vaginalis G3]|eukprot:XP_001580288.1 hypothetical protein [Trichomonas vaginalis G3]
MELDSDAVDLEEPIHQHNMNSTDNIDLQAKVRKLNNNDSNTGQTEGNFNSGINDADGDNGAFASQDQNLSQNYAIRKIPKSLPIDNLDGNKRIPLAVKLDVSSSNHAFPVGKNDNQNSTRPKMTKSPSINHFSAKTIIYRVKREVKISWKGSRTHFQQYYGEIPQYHVKVKTLNIGECIKISAGNNSHFSNKSFAEYILINKDLTDISLRVNHQHGLELFNLKLSKNANQNESKNAEARIKFDDGSTFEYTSQPQEILPESLLKKEIPKIITSIKNTVLEDSKNYSRICIGKIDKDTLQINADERVKPIIVFTLGVVLFLCKF